MGVLEEILSVVKSQSNEIHALHVKITELSEKIVKENTECYLSTDEAAAYVGYSRGHFYRLSENIPCSQPGAHRKYKKSDLDKWMKHFRKE